MKNFILALALITFLCPGINAWIVNNRLYVERDGITHIFIHSEIGESISLVK